MSNNMLPTVVASSVLYYLEAVVGYNLVDVGPALKNVKTLLQHPVDPSFCSSWSSSVVVEEEEEDLQQHDGQWSDARNLELDDFQLCCVFVVIPLVMPVESLEDVGSFALHPVAHVQHGCLLLQGSKPGPRCGAELACTTTVGRAAPLARHVHPCVFHDHFRLLGVPAACSCGVWPTHSRLSSEPKQVRQCELTLVTSFFSSWILDPKPNLIFPLYSEVPHQAEPSS